MAFVRRKGTQLVIHDRPVTFAGLGIGSWLNMEHFMLGLPTTHKQIREAVRECFGAEKEEALWDDFVCSFCGEEDFAFLKETGINLVRVPFHYGLFIDDGNPDVIKEEGFRYFDRLLSFCRKYEIYLLPDLHATPGGQNPDWHSDNQTGIPQFWHFKVFQQQMVKLWRAFAEHYVNEEYLLGFDLLNEPYLIPACPGKLQTFYDEVTAAIREVDQNHLIFVEGDFFAMDFQCLGELKDDQTALTFHYYPACWDPELGEPDYPRDKRRQVIEERFCIMLEDMRRFGRPLLCGEAGYDIAGRGVEKTMELVEDTLDVFLKFNISWTLWSYKDAQIMGVVYPKDETLWMQFATEIRKKWNHHTEKEMVKVFTQQIMETYVREIPEDMAYQLSFRQIAFLEALQKEFWLKALLQEWGWERVSRMPASLRFENCDFYEDYRVLLADYAVRTKAGAI